MIPFLISLAFLIVIVGLIWADSGEEDRVLI